MQYLPFKGRKLLIILVATFTVLQCSISVPAMNGMGVGTKAPDFSLKTIDGEVRNFASLKGDKLTLILFWASWSRQSEKALRRMKKLEVKYKDMGLSVIGINVDRQVINAETLTDIKSTVERVKVPFPILIDHGLVAFHDYGIIAVPSTVILDAKRKIMFEMSGFPLVATRDMIHFLAASIEGKKAPSEIAAKIGYHPNKKAVRHWNMGVKAMKSRRTFKSAEKSFKKAIEADPQFILPYLSLGSFYEQQNKDEQAKEQFQQALRKRPDNVKALSELGLFLLKEGSLVDARELLEKAIKSDESYTPSYYYLGYLTGIEGDSKTAAELFATAKEINPMDYQINIYRGMMFEEQQDLKQAAISYQNALKQLLNLQ